jgi:hypothetical protein
MATMSINEEVKLLRKEVRELREMLNEVLTCVSKPKYTIKPFSLKAFEEEEDEDDDDENDENEEHRMEEIRAIHQAQEEFRTQCIRFCDKDENGMFNIGGLSVSRLKDIQRMFKQTGQIALPSKIFVNTPANIAKIKAFMNHFVFS